MNEPFLFWRFISVLAKVCIIFPLLACSSSVLITVWLMNNSNYCHSGDQYFGWWAWHMYIAWVGSAATTPLIIFYYYLLRWVHSEWKNDDPQAR
jgi:hypothetical protein